MNTENNIRKFLFLNSTIVIGTVVLFLGFLIYSICVINAASNNRNTLYAVANDGSIIPVSAAEKRENKAIEMAHHLYMFVDNYYNINQNNWERKVDKALWLGDLRNDYTNRNNEGYYTNIVQWGVERQAELKTEDIELNFADENTAAFKITFNVKEIYVDRNSTKAISKDYLYFVQGVVKTVDRNFPWNPHGLYIVNFREDKRVEIKK